jgi:acetate kinase
LTNERILTVNAGSSSLKVALFDGASPQRRIASHTIARLGGTQADPGASLEAALAAVAPHGGLDGVVAVGHRIVHGGPRYATSQPLTDEVLEVLRGLTALDPDHMPAAIALIDALRARAPELPQIACFDTAFHRTMPRVARMLAIPRLYEEQGLQRYGFHGLSYTYLAEELARVAGEREARGRVVMAHLGSGASLAALVEGRSVDTTMGFTPNSGIPMGTRSGDIEPGVLLYMLRTEHLDVDALDDLLNRRSGLLGVSETSSDVRDLLERKATDPRAADAVALFCQQARKAVGATCTWRSWLVASPSRRGLQSALVERGRFAVVVAPATAVAVVPRAAVPVRSVALVVHGLGRGDVAVRRVVAVHADGGVGLDFHAAA